MNEPRGLGIDLPLHGAYAGCGDHQGPPTCPEAQGQKPWKSQSDLSLEQTVCPRLWRRGAGARATKRGSRQLDSALPPGARGPEAAVPTETMGSISI